MKKSEQIQLDIEKAEEQLLTLQERLKKLHRKKQEAVDAELLGMVKEITCEPGELAAIIKAFQNGNMDYFKRQLQAGASSERLDTGEIYEDDPIGTSSAEIA